jgi:hypothetical protein
VDRPFSPTDLEGLVRKEVIPYSDASLFAGLYHGIAVFDAKAFRTLSRYLFRPGERTINETQRELSFLRSSGIRTPWSLPALAGPRPDSYIYWVSRSHSSRDSSNQSIYLLLQANFNQELCYLVRNTKHNARVY